MRSGTWARGIGVLALALWALPVRVLATTAADLCASTANPCVVNKAVAVDNGSTIDVGARELRIASGGALDVGSGTMTLRAAKLTIDANGFVRALGTAIDGGGALTVEAGDVTITGTVDASGAPGGTITITATGALAAPGVVTARALSLSEGGGTIQLTASTATVSGSVSVKGGPDADGGDLAVDTSGDLTVTGTLDASGGEGGSIETQAGTTTSNGNLVLGDTAVLRIDATAAGGTGGEVDATAIGDGTSTGLVTITGLLSVKGLAATADIGGGLGGCLDIQATGDIRVDRASATLTAEGGAPDGDGGEVDLTSDAGGVVLQGTAIASVAGDESSGGNITIDSFGDVTIGGSILATAGASGGGEADVSSNSGSISVAKAAVIDVSSTAGEGGVLCLDSSNAEGGARSVLVEGRLAADAAGSGGSSGGSIDLEGVDSVRVAGTGTLHASGGLGGGRGGTLTINADPGIVSLEGPLVAAGGNPNGAGGVISVDAGGRISVSAPFDGRGFGTGGTIGISTATGPVDILSNVSAGSTMAAGGSIEVMAQGDVRVAGTLVTDGTMAPGGRIEITGCATTVCGFDSPSCPAGGVGILSSLGPSGVNRVVGRDSSAILGTMRANSTDGRNELVYDGDTQREPLVLGQVTPAKMVLVDATVVPCPACGNHVIEAPETCDDGNQNDGDGCSSSCQIEASIPGDANGDSVLSPDDVLFAIAEIFDGDGDSVTMVSGGAFPGAPGVDANGDQHVTAADLTATIKLLKAP